MKFQGTTEDKIEHLEECKTQIGIYSPKCPSLEKPALGNSQSPPKNGKHELNDSKQKCEESKQKLEAGKSFYFHPSDFKTELKIIGQIRELGQKEKLSFVSLARQIEGAKNKVDKVLRSCKCCFVAINPGMRLKSYLEGLGDLTLSWLRRLLRSHYQEKSATEF